MKKIYLLINSLELERGGLTKANLQQASMFSELGYETYILTFNYNSDYNGIIEDIYDVYKVNKKVKIINMYDYFRNEDQIDQKFKSYKNLINDDSIVEKNDSKDIVKIYENGLYKKNISYRSDESIKKIDYFNNSNYRIKVEFYAPEGYIGKLSYMDYNLNRPRQMTFYNSIGNCYLRKTVNPENGLATKVDLIKKGQIVHSFRSDRQLKSYFVEQIVNNNKDSVIISDARNTDDIMINIKNENSSKNVRLHSNHLSPNGEIAKTVMTSLENLKNIDSLIVLTSQQKEDIVNNYGYSEKVKVIPHGIQTLPSKDINNIIRKNKAVVISRLVKLKQIDHIIKAMQLIKDDDPDFILEIYGNGNELENLKSLVKKNKLENNIIFKGYTNNPLEIYNESLFSITTSKSEGFSLSILESMASGTPVISYDFKYGPEEIIDNNKNGLVINKDNIKELAEKILYLKNNEKVLKDMSEKSIEKIEKKFSIQSVKKKWFEFIENNNITNPNNL